MHSARGLHCDETVVDELAAEELSSELWRTREEFRGHIHLRGNLGAVHHIARLVERVSNFEGGLGIPDFLLLGGELLRLNLVLLDLAHVLLNFTVDGYVKLALLTHLVQHLVFESPLTVL